eukprot:728738-Alexandrium_andersonii.AAC.1
MDPLWPDCGQPAGWHLVPSHPGPGGGLPGPPRGHLCGMPRAPRAGAHEQSHEGPGRRTRRPPPNLREETGP